MSSGACATTLPVVSETNFVHGNVFSKSLPVSTKSILRKFLTQLTHGKAGQTSPQEQQQQQQYKFESDRLTKRQDSNDTSTTTTSTHSDRRRTVEASNRLSSSPRAPPIYPCNPKSRERTFDLLTLVPASPHSVMAPPPSPAVLSGRKRISPFDRIHRSRLHVEPADTDDSEELEMDFFLNESLPKNINNIEDEDDDNSSLGELIDCDQDEEQNDQYDENISFYADDDMRGLVTLTNCDDVEDFPPPEIQIEDFVDIATSERRTSQSLGPHLNDAFDLVRMIDLQGPWLADIDSSRIDWSDNDVSEVVDAVDVKQDLLTVDRYRETLSEEEEPSGWRKLRSMVQWTPFVQTFKNRRYQWVQLAGHSGNFKAGKNQGTVLKKCCPQEENCYKQFHNDSLHDYVPDYQGTLVLDDDEKFIQLQDCLSSFNLPSIMDCKIGVRTYLEEELAKAKEKPKLRKDMYEKMIAVDPSAPTEEEHRLKGITKPRYMVWRETISSTATLGFRIEGVKKNDGTSSKEFKTTKTKEQILESFRNFISGSVETAKQYLERLVIIRHALDKSEFFKSHELIGSSLLFVHDSTKACIWLIDFGKTVPVPEGTTIDHKSPWEVGNHEDGYLIGVENLIAIFSELVIVLEREGNGIDNSDCTTVPTTTTNLNIGKNKMLTSQPPSLS